MVKKLSPILLTAHDDILSLGGGKWNALSPRLDVLQWGRDVLQSVKGGRRLKMARALEHGGLTALR